MSIDSSGDQDTGIRLTGPTVTRDRWTHHALLKLSKGYVLIVSTTRKNVNFHSPQKGYEMCAYDVARKLIADGAVVKSRSHHLGDVYVLAETPPLSPAPISISDDDDVQSDSALAVEIELEVDALEDDDRSDEARGDDGDEFEG